MLNIRRTGSAEYGRFIKALICGSPGSGKTRLSASFPNAFYLTTEGLMMSIADDDIPYHHVTKLDDVLIALEMLKQVPKVREAQFGFPVETVVIDTIDDLSDMALKEHCVEEKVAAPRIQDYGWLKKQLQALTGGFRNLDMNVIFTSHLKSTDIGGVSAYLPGIEGGFADKIAGYFDLAVVLKSELVTEIVDGQVVQRVERFMQTDPDNQYQFIKDHSNKLPGRLPITLAGDDYQRIADLIFAGRSNLEVLPTENDAKLFLLNLTSSKEQAEAIWKGIGADEWTEWKISALEDAVAAATKITEVKPEPEVEKVLEPAAGTLV